MANDMNFEEKIDAMRMNLELASHDIEALRASIEAMGSKIETLRLASASQYDSIQGLMTISSQLVQTAQAHERRISGLEGRA
jgi:uncharacterized protein YbaP (TraB family)